jgi:hypothetical protein
MSLKQIANIRIGICNFVFNGVDLGHTLDGITVEVERNFQDLTVDKYGDTPIDKAVIGHKATIKARFAEPVAELLTRISPEGLNQTGTLGTRNAFGTDAGELMRQYAYLLTLHPIKNTTTDYSEDIVYYKAVNINNISLEYKIKDQRAVEVNFEALIDESQPSGRRLGHIGLTAIS